MNETQFFNQLFFQGVNTFVSAIAIALLAGIVFLLLKRKVTSKKQMRKIRSRVIYVAIVIFLLALIRIWIDGFSHLFTMLSLVAAGLVITNKENIMNFTGWTIINWRGLFSEGDAIPKYKIILGTWSKLSYCILQFMKLRHWVVKRKRVN
ncbi:mechanosensitive ion channel [Facilibium subflavum]|uniref:mechanosensitive ion channel n=1 Tax=Facilibium subflavum TaxID=2219058 RepID=UPI001F1C5D20|nr:mechanosensitive ion channel [Facilibium subflavum]